MALPILLLYVFYYAVSCQYQYYVEDMWLMDSKGAGPNKPGAAYVIMTPMTSSGNVMVNKTSSHGINIYLDHLHTFVSIQN